MNPSGVNPSTLSNKRPYSPSASSSSSTLSEMTPRKRPRVSEGATSGERKEARAARNRIAAQESRDRRKREFAELHQRVAQLEVENAALRENKPAVIGIEKTERLERENAELLERDETGGGAHDSVTPDPRWCYSSRIAYARPVPSSLLVPSSLTECDGAINRDYSPPSTGGDRPFSFIGCQGDAPAAGGLDPDALLSSLAAITNNNSSATDNTNTIVEAADNTSTTDIIDIEPPLAPFDDLHAFDFSSLTAPPPAEDFQAMGGTEFWLCPTEETSLAPDNSALATAPPTPNDADVEGMSVDETATLEQTLLSLFNDMVESVGGAPNVDLEMSASTSDAAPFDPATAIVDFSSLTWPEEITL